MNLRNIKKDIEYVLGAFIDDCTLVGTVNPNVDENDVAGLIEESVDLFNGLKDRVNAKGMKKADFAQVRKDLLVKTDELYEKLSKLVKESVEGPRPAKKAAKPAEEKAEKPAAKKPASKKTAKAAEENAEKPAEEKAEKKPAAKKPAAKKAAPKAEKPAEEKDEKPAAKKPAAKKTAAKKAEE